MHERLVGEIAGIVDEKFCGEVVHAVDHHVIGPHDAQGVRRGQAVFVGDDVHIRVEGLDFFLGRDHLGPTQIRGVMDDLTLEVGQVDDIRIDHAERPHTRRGQIQPCW